jgi:hypothetical protein
VKLSAEQMRFLADKGLSLEDVIAFASMTPERSAGATRQAAYRERKKAQDTECDVTSDVTSDASQAEITPPSAPPNDIYSNPPHHPPITQLGVRDAFPRPDWCQPAVWRDLKRNRKAKKLANTETAHRKFIAAVLAMADDDWPPGRLVEAIAANGWGGAYDPRQSQNDRKPANVRTAPSNRNTAELALAKLGMAGG